MFSLPDAAKAIGAKLVFADSETRASGASIDTRSLKPGDCFFALPGTQTDGHAFLPEAFRLGASSAVVSSTFYEEEIQNRPAPEGFKNLLVVENPEIALAEIAAWRRSQCSIPFIGITGSVGKTSTKEFLQYLLQAFAGEGSVLATRGNLNNHLGLPLTLLNLTKEHRFCVAEIGANARGDIAFLCKILKPTAGILTCVAPVHLKGFGSLETIYQTKTDLLRALPSQAPAVISSGDSHLDALVDALDLSIRRAGSPGSLNGKISAVRIDDGWVSFCFRDQFQFAFPGLASFLVLNAAMALLMAEALGVDLAKLPERWEGFCLPEGRFSVKNLGGGVRVIFDGYNSSPKACEKALETFASLPLEGRRIAVVSDMLELGEESEAFHRQIGEKAAERELDAIFAYGPESRAVIQGFKEKAVRGESGHFESADSLARHLAVFLKPGDMVLMKASRGMKIERVLQSLEADSRFARTVLRI